ncbi:iron-sulfur cluster repair di-iron protein [Compostibacter hankyongensis]|uniref:Iron-sulfur cluster repair di-iron protein n=1 Tax=Compostibacter hankyongensis TaxID=1007089 RepID=A0ABP8FD06_9BACT
MIITQTLDVTQIEPRLKHPTIFSHFDALEPGEGFCISNDHDPKPLYYQLLGERGNIFSWEYLENGPDLWRIRIAKNEAEEGEVTVGAIAAGDRRKAEVFRKMGIDYCCGGQKTLKAAVSEAGIPEERLRAALKEAEKTAPSGPVHDYDGWDLGFLADYIINIHHRYVKDNAEAITELALKVGRRHGDHHPELNILSERVHLFMDDLLQHMVKEERVLFPQIKRMAAGGNAGAVAPGLISNAVKMMEQEHTTSGDDLRFFRRITSDYSLPADACNAYAHLFEQMKAFEDDLIQHLHLENNILFPKAVKLEETWPA